MNLQLYQQSTPLEYNLTKVSTDVQIIYGTKDFITSQEVIFFFYNLIKNIIANRFFFQLGY